MSALLKQPIPPGAANENLPARVATPNSGAMLVHVVNRLQPRQGLRRFANCEGFTVTEAIERAGWQLAYSTVLVRDGVKVPRTEWDARLIEAGEVVMLVTMPTGGGGVSRALAVVATIALAVFAPEIAGFLATQIGYAAGATIIGGLTVGGLLTVGVVLAGTTLISALLPPPRPGITDQSALSSSGASGTQSPTYSLSAQSNSARLYQTIPERFGRQKVKPDLSTAPYFDFSNSDQELMEEFCYGIGEYSIEEIGVSNTPIWRNGAYTGNYPEIEILIMPPGFANTLFSNNVVTSTDVSNIELIGTNEDGYAWIGPFPLNPAGSTISYAEFDASAPGGLFTIDSTGNMTAATASFQVQLQVIDDDGASIGDWFTVLDQTLTQATRDAIRTTYPVTIPAARYQVRFERTNAKSTNVNTLDQLNMIAMRGFLPNSAPPSDTTRIAIRARTTINLNGDSAQDFYVIGTRVLPIWDAARQTWGQPQPTRSIAWAAAYACRATNGMRKRDNQVDLDKLAALDAIWAARGDEFNGTFDTGDAAWTSLQNILRCGRAEPLKIGRYVTFNRDEPKVAYAGGFNPTNILNGTFSIDYLMFDNNSTDGLWVLILDERNWQPLKVWCALPDSTTDPANAPTVDLSRGVTKRDQGWREGMFLAGCNRYRRRFPTFRTDLEGRACFRGSKILVGHWMPKWGGHGQVLDLALDDAGDIITLTEPWDQRGDMPDGTPLVRLITPDGHVWGPVPVEILDDGQVSNFAQVRLLDNAVVASGRYAGRQPRDWNIWSTLGSSYEYPRAMWGVADYMPQDALLMSMKPDNTGATIACVLDDQRVHSADGTVPPVEGETPEPPIETAPPPMPVMDQLTITALNAAEVAQAGVMLAQPVISITVAGARDAVDFDARWKWGAAGDFSPRQQGLGRTFTFLSSGGQLTLQVRARGKSGFGNWYETIFIADGIPAAAAIPAGATAPAITVVHTWAAAIRDADYTWTADAAATSYIVTAQINLPASSAWIDTNAVINTSRSFSISKNLTYTDPATGAVVSPHAVRIGVRSVYPAGSGGIVHSA